MVDLTNEEVYQKVENFFKHLERNGIISFDDSVNDISSGNAFGRNKLEVRVSRFIQNTEKYGVRLSLIKMRNVLPGIDDAVGTAMKYFEILFPPRRYPELWI